MGAVHVHEYMSLDCVISAPTWTFEYEFLPEMEKDVVYLNYRPPA